MNLNWLQHQWSWLLENPAGQRIGLGIALAVAIVVSFLMHKGFKRMARDGRHLPAIALVTLGGFYTAVMLLQLDPAGWAVAAVIAVATFLAAALVMNPRGSRKTA